MRPATGVRRATLPNGLRVVVDVTPPTPRVAVCVHYAVGHRDEAPGWAGFAHLFEHLMFRGSATLPPGGLYDLVGDVGGTANGTTHQDYTDYFQTVPAAALERVLFAEADRMRAPVFTPETVAEQLAGIAAEIRGATVDRPYGGLPWPLLPAVTHRDFANAHDGFGDVDALAGVRPEHCEEFFERHYAPGNAVLTVAGHVDPDAVVALVDRHFADVAARPVPARPALDVPAPQGDRWAVHTEPGVPCTAVAVGWPLPDPRTALPDYLDHVVLADLLRADRRDAGCGYFGPLDARAPDTLVLSGLTAAGGGARDWVAALDRRLDVLAARPGHGEVARARRLAVVRHHRLHGDLTARARARGRFELLFDDAGTLDELPGLLRDVEPSGVASAAAGLRDTPRGVLALEPGERRTRPDGPDDGPRDPARAASRRRAAAGRSLPALQSTVHLDEPAWADRVPDGGLRTVAVRDARVPLVELRLRLPLGPAGWSAPERVAPLLWLMTTAAGAEARAATAGGRLVATTDGQWLDVDGVAPTDGVERWLDLLHDVLYAVDVERPGVEELLDAGPSAPDPARVADDVLRRRWIGATPDRPGAAALRAGVTDPAGGCLLAVGDVDPDAFVRSAAARFPTTAGIGASGPVAPAVPSPACTTVTAGDDAVVLTVAAPEPPCREREAARYLATAVLSGAPGARCDRLTLLPGMAGFGAHAGRDVLGPHPRRYLRLGAPPAALDRAVAELGGIVDGLAGTPPSPAELDGAARFCAAQYLTLFDSPGATADGLVTRLARGATVREAVDFPAAVLRVTPAELARAAAGLSAALAAGAACSVTDVRKSA